MKTLPKRDDPSGIDLSPLIDMVFILLIFFMVTSTFVKDANVDLKRPSAQSATSASTKSLRVTLMLKESLFRWSAYSSLGSASQSKRCI